MQACLSFRLVWHQLVPVTSAVVGACRVSHVSLLSCVLTGAGVLYLRCFFTPSFLTVFYEEGDHLLPCACQFAGMGPFSYM